MTPAQRRSTLHEAAHKLDEDRRDSTAAAGSPGVRRSLNEAAHKLSYWPVRPEPLPEDRTESQALLAAADDRRDVVAHASRAVLALGALGIVYGDIGTSPLYTVQTIFTQHGDAARTTAAGVYGVASLIFWSLMIVVSIKYAGFIMRAHNRGDGGIMALTALVQRRKVAEGRPADRARHLRRGTVLRRRDDHPGDLGHLRGGGAERG